MRCKAVASKIGGTDDQTAETVTMEAMVPMQWLGGDGQPAMKNNRVNSVTRDQQSRSYQAVAFSHSVARKSDGRTSHDGSNDPADMLRIDGEQ